MKFFITLSLLMFITAASGQIVNIPDPNFKQFLIDRGFDTNQDGEIQQSEALNITTLSITGSTSGPIYDLTGIKSLSNLRILNASCSLSSLDLSGLSLLDTMKIDSHCPIINLSDCPSLKYAELEDYTSVSNLNLTGCHELRYLNCRNSNLTSLDVTDCANLTYLNCNYNHLTSLDVSNCTKLKVLDCGVNYMNSFVLGNMDSLVNLTCGTNAILNLDLRNCRNLIVADCAGYGIGAINASGLTKLITLNSYSNSELLHLDVSGCSALPSLNLDGDHLVDVNLTGCTMLSGIDIMTARIKSLDLSTCVNLRYFYNTSYALRYLNLKNGSMLSQFHIEGDTTLSICADDFEIDTLLHYFTGSIHPQNVQINSFCSFFPGGHYNTITGKIKLDQNLNGCDNSDNGIPQIPVRFTDASGQIAVRYTYTDGEYANYVDTGHFTVRPYFAYPYFLIAPLSQNVIFDTANSIIDTLNFCVSPTGVHNDLEISVLPWVPARPGFPATYHLIYKNRGTTTASGNVQLNFDNSKMNFDHASTAVSAQNPGQLVWNYTNLQPFQTRNIDVTFNILPPTINNVGDTLIYLASVNPVANDETPEDNSFILPQRLTGSFDPNDKICLEGSKIELSAVDKYLHYMIRFQNTGNDTAFNVVIADTLNSKYDWNTVEFTGSSHPCSVRRTNNRLEFIFENIKLPWQSINEPASHGFVAFKVKPKSNLVIGDSLKNKASIYFDFNLPVITNTALTIISPATTIPVKLEYFSAVARTNNNLLNWKASCTEGSLTFSIERSSDGTNFQSIGQIAASALRCQQPFAFTDQQPLKGKNYYRLKLTDQDGFSLYSKIVQIDNRNAMPILTAVQVNVDKLIVYLNSDKKQNLQMKIISSDGKMIYGNSIFIAEGTHPMIIPVNELSKGVYTIVGYTDSGNMVTKKFVY